jgi:hypothetical protein
MTSSWSKGRASEKGPGTVTGSLSDRVSLTFKSPRKSARESVSIARKSTVGGGRLADYFREIATFPIIPPDVPDDCDWLIETGTCGFS